MAVIPAGGELRMAYFRFSGKDINLPRFSIDQQPMTNLVVDRDHRVRRWRRAKAWSLALMNPGIKPRQNEKVYCWLIATIQPATRQRGKSEGHEVPEERRQCFMVDHRSGACSIRDVFTLGDAQLRSMPTC